MDLSVSFLKRQTINKEITISGSKSESNRLLILQKLFTGLTIRNLSDADDTIYLQRALSTKKDFIDIEHAGTAMRFLTAYFAIKKDTVVVLTGSERMQNRPIKILVTALKDLGASIDYEQKEGYPPIRIQGKEIVKNNILINGNVSSQYISALLLIAAKLKNGLIIELTGKITSMPYIKMTLGLLRKLGIETDFNNNCIKIKPLRKIVEQTITVESDWSSASYFYSIVALSKIGTKIKLATYKKESLQGDSYLSKIYEYFGVKTVFEKNFILLEKETTLIEQQSLTLNLKNTPDIAQTIAVTCFGLGISCHLIGLHTLKIKETDRLEALQRELTNLGATVSVTDQSLDLKAAKKINKNCAINTYDDHRMAMAFTPLALVVPICILNAEVVSKSYPSFWKDMQQIGIQIKEL